jgi:hypothetical protein
MKLITANQANAVDIHKRYYGQPARFLEEILGMELDDWQRELCDNLHKFDRHAVASGHSSGKTALTAGLIQYFIAVHPDPQIIVTANTELQLRQKTWRELAKWHSNSLLKEWFKWTATTFSMIGAENTWFAAAVPNTPHSSESFAGAHEKYMLMVFDEASSIERSIWEVAEGATATEGGYRKWLVFGNPTKNDGAFAECFAKNRHRWHCVNLDTRGCKYSDQSQIKQWAEDYGEESDFFKVRVKGEFPSAGSNQFISREDVAACIKYEADGYEVQGKIMSVDVARYGDDSSVILRRQGRKVHPPTEYRGMDTMRLSDMVIEQIREWKPDAVVVDEVGVGAGVVDRLRQLKYGNIIHAFNGGSAPINKTLYFNKRAETWGLMRAALRDRIDLPDHRQLTDDLVAPEYGFSNKQQIQLEKKEDMKRRGMASPDFGDALSMTYAVEIFEQYQPPVPKWQQRINSGRSAQSA